MLKFRIPEIVLGALLTVAVFATGYVVASSMQPPSQRIEQADHPHTANESAERTAEKQIAYYTKWLAWFTAALVAVSAIQGYFLLRADKTARIAANAGQLSAESVHGLALPIIGADSPELLDTHGPIPEDGAFGGSSQGDLPGEFSAIPAIIFRNDGQTPAFPIKVVVEWRIGATSSDGNPRFKIYEYSSAIITEISSRKNAPSFFVGVGKILAAGCIFSKAKARAILNTSKAKKQLRAPACLSQRI